MANDKSIVAFALGAHGIADDLARATHFDNRVGVGIVRRYAFDINLGAFIDDGLEMGAQSIPVNLAILVIDVALIPDAHFALLRHHRPLNKVAV